jgi:hypothetical protein
LELKGPVTALRTLGAARLILATAANSKSMSPLLGGLAPRGQLIVAGAGGIKPIEVDPVPLLFGMRSIAGTMTGGQVSLLGGFAWIPHLLADASQHVEKTIVTFKYGVCSIVSLNRNPC